jgi:hypothetical protein
MSEASMWKRVKRALTGCDAIRIENRCELGTPDCNIATGAWVELKIADAPKRGGILTINHYSTEQRVWAVRRAHAGGKTFVLIKISNLWILLKGEVAAKYLNYTTIEELKGVAVKSWQPKLIDHELREFLTSS